MNMRKTKEHFYKGFLIEKPEGCEYWNIYRIEEDGIPNYCFPSGFGRTLKEARESVEVIIEYGE